MDLLFISKRIFLNPEQGFINGGIIVDTEGIIRKILGSVQEVNSYLYNTESEAVYDFENLVLMPGLIDANVHIHEPGREDWEGFKGATKAAAAGGFTTIIDGSSTSIPPTTSAPALKTKTSRARGKIFVDVGFWGGLVPESMSNIESLTEAGVIGLQCTLCPLAEPISKSFAPVNRNELDSIIAASDDVLLAIIPELPIFKPLQVNLDDPQKYESYLNSRPVDMEVNAVQFITELARKNKNKTFHILNVSSDQVLDIIEKSKRDGAQITANTCPHYLTLAAEDIEDCHTEFKTQPPIRCKNNHQKLWEALKNGTLDMISTDHSPTTPKAKCLTYGRGRGDFLNAWPGVSSLQLGLSIVWTHAHKYGLGIRDIYRLMCANPATICGIHRFKGKIEEGYDADFCIWNPEEEFCVTPDMMFSTNKMTPYINQRLKGVVHATVVRGIHVYQKDEHFGQPLGMVILKKSSKKIVKFVRM